MVYSTEVYLTVKFRTHISRYLMLASRVSLTIFTLPEQTTAPNIL